MSANLQRKIGLYTTISIVAGSVIGSSIFMKPAVMAGQLPSPILLIAVWVIAGLISIIGASINAEVGTMMPVTGGQYVFFQKMYGNFFAYLYGWAAFAVINTASIASIAFIASQYFEYFVTLPRFTPEVEHSIKITLPFIGILYPLENIVVKALTIFIVVLFTLINVRSVKAGGKVQLILSIIKVAALVLMVLLILFSGKGNINNFTTSNITQINSWQMIAAFIAATSGAFAAYDGWNNIGFVAGEVKEPAKNLPRGLIIGLGICIALYVITNFAYLYMLPIQKMATSNLVATDALQIAIGSKGSAIIALLVIVSAIGCTNGNILACARVTFEMARQGNFFNRIGNVDEKHQTPKNALWLHCIWTCLFAISGSFDMLTDLFVFITWIFYGFAAYGVFVLRRKMPNAERPYKCIGYPILPAIFVLFSLFYFVVTLYTDIQNYISGKTHFINSVFGLALTLLGVPLYYYFKKKYK